MASYVVALFLLLGLSQAREIVDGSPAFLEDLRNGGGSRIVGGWEAEEEQIPHQASLRMVNFNGDVFSCGGSVISDQWVLTAAHCLTQRHSFVVRLGVTHMSRPAHIQETSDKFIHPIYDETSQFVQTDDIALLKLKAAVTFSNAVKPIRLQRSEQRSVEYQGLVVTVSGFGLTDDTINGGTTSNVLRWVLLRGITNQECRMWYGGSSVIQAQTMCAESYNHTSQSSCQGDSGGPLTFVDTDGELTQVGIVSFGSTAGCNSPFPSAYVRPEHYHEWITTVTGLNLDWSRLPVVPTTHELNVVNQ